MTDHVTLQEIAEVNAGVEEVRDATGRAHLEVCPDCRELAGQLAHVTHLLSTAPREIVPTQVSQAVLTALAEESRRRESARLRPVSKPAAAREPSRASRTADGKLFTR